jgi:SagB-type dehydrogenase family enzyme
MKYYCAFGVIAVIFLNFVPFVKGEERDIVVEKGIILPVPRFRGELSLEEAIYKRRSVRSFTSQQLTWEQISQLLWATQGETDKERGFRAAPSAGALYPLEIYLLNAEGMFHYIPSGHKLEMVSKKDLRPSLARAALFQNFISEAPVSIVVCAVYGRTMRRYGQRGRRYVHIEVGHAAENLNLQAVSLGLGSVCVGAFDDQAIRSLLALPSGYEPLYIIPVGYVK